MLGAKPFWLTFWINACIFYFAFQSRRARKMHFFAHFLLIAPCRSFIHMRTVSQHHNAVQEFNYFVVFDLLEMLVVGADGGEEGFGGL